jgi:hypothetical protein
MYENPFSTYGRLVNMLPYYGGRCFVVCPTSSSFYSMLSQQFPVDGDGTVRLFTSVSAAYDATTSGGNDVIALFPGTYTLTDMLTVSKNLVHFVGLDVGGPSGRLVQQAAKIQLSGTTSAAAVIKVTGTRNSFQNIKFIQGSTAAAALNVAQMAGEGNLWEDCSFIFGVADNLGSTSANECLFGEDSGTLIRCSFGTDVLTSSASTGRAVFTLDAITGASSADGAKSNRIVDCEFFIMSSSANAVLVKLADTAGAKFLNKFVRPSFVAVINNSNSAIAITNAIASAAGFVEGSLVFEHPTTANCTNGCAGVTDKVVVTAPAASANAFEGVTPS